MSDPTVMVKEVGCSCGWKAELSPLVTLDEANRLMQEHSHEAHEVPSWAHMVWET